MSFNRGAPRLSDDAVSPSDDDVMNLLLGHSDERPFINRMPEKAMASAALPVKGLVEYRAMETVSLASSGGPSLFGASQGMSRLSLSSPHGVPPLGCAGADAWAVPSAKKGHHGLTAAASWAGAAVEREQPFATPQLQPFFHDESTVTQFRTTRPSEEVFSALLRAARELDCRVAENREEGTVQVTAFVDHGRVTATVRVYRESDDRHLVSYARTFGDHMTATRLFFTLANASGLVQLQLPRLLRRSAARECCALAADTRRSGSEEKAAPAVSESAAAPAALTVFVEMLGSVFAEETLVGAQGLARACCCPLAARPYVPHLASIVEAFRKHEVSGCSGHLVSRDVVACIAGVVATVARAALLPAATTTSSAAAATTKSAAPETCCEVAVQGMLRCAANGNADAECARASLQALTSLCTHVPGLKECLVTDHRRLVDDALECKGSSAEYLRASARALRVALDL
jgi:hypothetical protein